MALFLGGGGDPPLSAPIDEAFARAVTGGRVVYLPTALQGSPLFSTASAWFGATYGPLGITDVDTWDRLDDRSFTSVEDLAGVYVGGGNTYLLLRELRRSGLDSELRELIRRGVHVYGGSAGAIVLGADITTSDLGGDERLFGEDDHTGLDVLAGWSVSCHDVPAHDEFLDAWLVAHTPVLRLAEDAGAVVEADRLTVVGSGAVLHTTSLMTPLVRGTHDWPPAQTN